MKPNKIKFLYIQGKKAFLNIFKTGKFSQAHFIMEFVCFMLFQVLKTVRKIHLWNP